MASRRPELIGIFFRMSSPLLLEAITVRLFERIGTRSSLTLLVKKLLASTRAPSQDLLHAVLLMPHGLTFVRGTEYDPDYITAASPVRPARSHGSSRRGNATISAPPPPTQASERIFREVR